MSAVLAAHDLHVRFAGQNGNILEALGPLSVKIAAGTFVALIGPSGSGKSTLVRVFAGLQKAAAGTATIDGQIIHEPSPKVGMMFQDANLMPWRSVRDNVGLPLELAGIAKAARHAAVQDLLPVLGLEDFAGALPAELSGGMAQRVALGRVLVQQPDVLLLDEPFGALDAFTREQISLDLLRMWATLHPTVLMVTHDINEAVLLADRILVLSRRPGRIIGDVPVNLPRPRQLDMIYTPEFLETARLVRSLIDHQ